MRTLHRRRLPALAASTLAMLPDGGHAQGLGNARLQAAIDGFAQR